MRFLPWTLVLGLALPGQHGVEVVSADHRVPATTLTQCATIARDSLTKLGPTFDGTPTAPIRMVVHVDQTTVGEHTLEGLPGHFAGFARLGADEFHILLEESGTQPGTNLRSIIGHELVHVLLDQWAGEGRAFIPRWVHEGLAQALTGSSLHAISEESLMFGIHARTLPRFVDLAENFPLHDDESQLAYAQSQSFVEFLIDRVGVRAVLDATRNCRADVTFPVALWEIVGISQSVLQQEWEEYVLYSSGAIARFLQRNCFSFLMVLGVPLLTIAVVRRRRRDRAHRRRLEVQELAVQESLPPETDADPERGDAP